MRHGKPKAPVRRLRRTFVRHCAALLLLCSTSWHAHVHAHTDADPVTCSITSLDMQFPELNPMVQGRQWGEGHVEVHCINTAAHPRRVALTVVSTDATAHTLQAQPRNPEPMVIRFYTDQAHIQALGNAPSQRQALRGALRLKAHSASSHQLPLYAAFQLTALMGAGSYSGDIPLRLVYQSTR